MAKNSLLLLSLLLALFSLSAAVHGYVNQDQGGGQVEPGSGEEHGGGGSSRFLLQESMQVVRTDAGEMRVTRGGGGGGRFGRSPLVLAWITMEPSSLFIPQYLDSNLILFIRRGGAKIGHIYKDDFVEKTLEEGDVYTIEAGMPFYIVNGAQGQRLHVIASIEPSESYGWQWNKQGFQSFFIGGGTNPPSILSGFEPYTMSTALNISMSELQEFLSSQHSGPIVHFSNTSAPSLWSKFLGMNKCQKLAHLNRAILLEEERNYLLDEQPSWSFRRFLTSFLGRGDDNRKSGDSGPEAYNIFNRKPDFSNDYGSTKAVSQHDYSPLRRTNTGIYLVNLTAGAMLAPHINPRATEYGVVLNGVGSIQIVFPNGTLAMNAEVREGDAFWIPRYYPFCQIASRSGDFVFFGYTTSARNNRPQFLVGANSLLSGMAGPEFAAAFGTTVEKLQRIAGAQNYSAILPAATASPGGGQGE